MAKPDTAPLTADLLPPDYDLIRERQIEIKKWLRQELAMPAYIRHCGDGIPDSHEGGIVRNYAAMFWRVATSHSGRILLLPEAYALIKETMNFTPSYLLGYVHQQSPWQEMISGDNTTSTRFWTMHVDGLLVPKVVPIDIIPELRRTSTNPITMSAWLGQVGGTPGHHSHLTPVILFIAPVTVAQRGYINRIDIQVSGGVKSYKFSIESGQDWAEVDEYGDELVLTLPADLALGQHTLDIKVTDAFGQEATATTVTTVV